LDRVKNFEINHFPFEIETPQRKLGLLMDEEFYGIKGFLEDFEKNVDKITADEVNRAAKKYLSPDNIAIVCIVSDGEKFKDELLSEKTEIEYPSGTDALVLKKEDDEVKKFDLRLKPEDIVIWKVTELFR
jgi:zinc protease